jgi:hypothetical protein
VVFTPFLLRRLAVPIATVILVEALGGSTQGVRFPPRLEGYLSRYVKLTDDERAQLSAGAPVTKLLDSDPSKEIVVFGGVWIKASITSYLAAVRNIADFESGGGFRITKKLSSPPRLDDFAELTIPDDDVRDLRSCRVDNCQLQLSKEGIERMRREIDWTKPDAGERVNAMARELALIYVRGYLEGGNARLAVYRDADRPRFVANELQSMIERLPSIAEFLPDVQRYLLEFPKASLAGSESFLYWQEAEFGLKPTIRINHLTIAQQPDGGLVVSKMLYASHYFWTALELRALVRDPSRADGFWLITESRSRSNGLSGFTGRIIRGKVRGEAEKGTAAVLQVTKKMLENQ